MNTEGGGVCFAGVYRMRLGSGGRLVIPKAFRDQLETDTVTVGLAPRRGALVIMPPGVLGAALQKLAEEARRGLALTYDQTKMARYLDMCRQTPVSAQGRITLHRVFLGWALRDEAEAVLLGLGDKILVVGAMAFDAMAVETRDALALELATVYG
jgi:DNA-binding transcriptional regulator/RsmH inhibitor MraZ